MGVLKNAMKLVRRACAIGFTLLTAVAVAQNTPANTCSALVRSALVAANAACSGTTRNHVCYGNIFGEATPAQGVTDLVFEAVGDTAALDRIQALRLSAFDEAADQWGVALMQLQASLPDTLPGQNVTFLMFGDVAVEANTGEQVRIDATVTQPSNLRLGPNASGIVLGSVPRGAPVIASGKAVNSAGQLWVRIRYEGYRTGTGWVLGELVDVDFDALPEVTADSLSYNPMQAFYFKTGIGQPQCIGAPVDGVVVQTPQGAGKISFNVNGLDIALGSTALLTSPEAADNTCVSLITGGAELRGGGEILNLRPGEKSCTTTNEDGTAGKPGAAQPFDPDEIASIADVLDALPDDVTIPDPAPTRTPTPRFTQPPRATGSTPTVTPIPTQTEYPGGPTNPPPSLTPVGAPTSTPVSPGRFASISPHRVADRIDVIGSGGPDAPSSYSWTSSVGPASGPNASFTFGPGNSYTIQLQACWPDSECHTATVSGTIPPCPIDFTQSAPMTLTYNGSGEQYEVFSRNEACGFDSMGVLASGTMNMTGFIGQFWDAKELPALASPVWSTTITSTSPVFASIP